MLVTPTTNQEGFLMSFRTQVLTFCKEHNITVFDASLPSYQVNITLWTPKGKVFTATGSHNVVAFFWIEPKVYTKNDAWRELVEDIQYGIEDCTNPICDTCNDDREVDEILGKG